LHVRVVDANEQKGGTDVDVIDTGSFSGSVKAGNVYVRVFPTCTV